MIIILDDKHKLDLQFIKDRPVEVISDFVRISVEFIKNGANPKLYNSAAKTLGVDVKQIEAVIEGIARLFQEGARFMISEQDFLDTLLVLGFSKEHNQQLKELYLANRQTIRTLQKQLSFDLPHYVNMDWRLDVQLASRCARGQLNPIFLLRLDTVTDTELKSTFLQTDYSNLKHLCEELEIALKEMKSAYCRRILRNIK